MSTTPTKTPTITQRTTRLAPSPTGALHLGNARTFLINWAMAKQNNWRIALRIDDLDTPRNVNEADLQAIEDLAWLGMDWHGEPQYQSTDLAPYHAAIEHLKQADLVYNCGCTRREIETAQSAPHAEDHELRYPGTCRPRSMVKRVGNSESADKPFALRIIIPNKPITFEDQFSGPQTLDVQQQVGDFVIQSKAALPSYQLATVIDDDRQGVTDIVRGDDLIRSTGRQLWLYRYLADVIQTPPPRYWHLPLVVGEDGRRLAKRHGDRRIAFYREQGVAPERIIGLLARWSGIEGELKAMTANTFTDRFCLADLPRDVAVFTEEDHAWLLA